jgi:hypothetical protein
VRVHRAATLIDPRFMRFRTDYVDRANCWHTACFRYACQPFILRAGEVLQPERSAKSK